MAKARSHDATADAARSEAVGLLDAIRRDLGVLSAFVDAEEANLDRKGLSAKRVARLRLISQDVGSACTFSRGQDKR